MRKLFSRGWKFAIFGLLFYAAHFALEAYIGNWLFYHAIKPMAAYVATIA